MNRGLKLNVSEVWKIGCNAQKRRCLRMGTWNVKSLTCQQRRLIMMAYELKNSKSMSLIAKSGVNKDAQTFRRNNYTILHSSKRREHVLGCLPHCQKSWTPGFRLQTGLWANVRAAPHNESSEAEALTMTYNVFPAHQNRFGRLKCQSRSRRKLQINNGKVQLTPDYKRERTAHDILQGWNKSSGTSQTSLTSLHVREQLSILITLLWWIFYSSKKFLQDTQPATRQLHSVLSSPAWKQAKQFKKKNKSTKSKLKQTIHSTVIITYQSRPQALSNTLFSNLMTL